MSDDEVDSLLDGDGPLAPRAPQTRTQPKIQKVGSGKNARFVFVDRDRGDLEYVTNRHKEMVALALQGWGVKDIAAQMGCRVGSVNRVLQDPKIRPYFEQAQQQLMDEINSLQYPMLERIRQYIFDDREKVQQKGIELYLKYLQIANKLHENKTEVNVNIDTGARQKLLRKLQDDHEVKEAIYSDDGGSEDG